MKSNLSFNWLAPLSTQQSLKEQSIKGGFATLMGQVAGFAVNMGSTAILARMIVPEDFGLIAMVVAFIGILFIFKDIGFSQLIIQKQELRQTELSSIFWLNLAVGGGISLLIAGLSPVVAAFYGEPKLLPLTLAFAAIPLINSLFIVQSALLNRHMFFGAISKILFFSNFIAILLTIALAYLGWGYWALTLMNIGTPFFSLVFFWVRCNWRPSWGYHNRGMRENMSFGGYITGFNLINYFSRNFDNIIVGRVLGAGPLGIYSKAYQLLMLPIAQIRDPIMTVGYPALSALRSDAQAYKSFYVNLISVLSFVSVPVIYVLMLVAEPIILIVLGPNWLEVADVFQILALTALIQPVVSTNGLVLLSMGETKRYFIFGVANAAVVIASFLIGVQFGLKGVAAGYAVANYLLLVPTLQYSFKNTAVRVKDFFGVMAYPILFGALSFGAIWGLDVMHWFGLPLWNAAAGGLGFLMIYGALWLLFPATRQRLFQVVAIAKTLKKKKGITTQ